jgi:hypothetical protein
LGAGQSGYANNKGAGFTKHGVGGSRQGGNVTFGPNGGAQAYNYGPGGYGYGGGFQRQKGGVAVNGRYDQPIAGIPGLRSSTEGTANFRGPNSSIGAKSGVYAGGYRAGEASGFLNGKGVSGGMQTNGPMRTNSNADLRFKGLNSKASGSQEYAVGGAAKARAEASLSRQGFTARGNVNVLGKKGSVSASANKNSFKKYDPGRAVPGTGLPSAQQVFGW